jgi:hypothetical protein
VDPLSNFARRPEKRSDRYATIGVEPGAAAHVGDERAALVPIAPYKSSGEVEVGFRPSMRARSRI